MCLEAWILGFLMQISSKNFVALVLIPTIVSMSGNVHNAFPYLKLQLLFELTL